MHYEEKSQEIGRLAYILDLTLTVFVYFLSLRIRENLDFVQPLPDIDFFSHAAYIPLILVTLSFLLPNQGAYKGLLVVNLFQYTLTLIKAMIVSLSVLIIFAFILNIQGTSRLVLGIFFPLNIFVLVCFRYGLIWWYFRKAVEKRENFVKILIIGAGGRAIRVSKELLKRTEWGIEVIGYVDPNPLKTHKSVQAQPIVGTICEMPSILKKHVVDEVILAVPRTLIGDVQEIVQTCAAEGVKLRMMADIFELHLRRMRLVTLGDIPLLTLEPVAQDEKKLLIKRLFDITFTLLIMPFLLPLIGIIAIAIKLDSPGPVFFNQNRVGLKKRVFPMFKFRSMHVDSEKKINALAHLNEADGPIFKIANDPRVTKLGKILRKTSLDEFPQFFNVLRGHMSLVGPRPMSVRDVDLFDESIQRKRFSVKPGLTCLWQISGRSNLPFSDWLRLDLEYIENWSLSLDLKIFLKTVPAILKGHGAV
ncbi:MAG: sugar transferase [Nitrospinota bacterium]